MKTSGKAPSPRRYVSDPTYSPSWALMLKHANIVKHITATVRKTGAKLCIHSPMKDVCFFIDIYAINVNNG